jgi:ribosomal protein S18 acetylase RimI-like enzyme
MSAKMDFSKLVIRNLVKDDFDQVVHIDSLATGYPRNHYFEKKFRRNFGEDSKLFGALVAEMDKKIIGFIMGEANSGEYGIEEQVASVDTLGLDPEYKRSGIGRRLLEEFCSIAEKAGIELMTTLVPKDWPDVIEFFKSEGFNAAGMAAFDRKLNPSGKFEK